MSIFFLIIVTLRLTDVWVKPYNSPIRTFATYRGIVDDCLHHESETILGIYLTTWDNGDYKHR
jgi:hypothetical protein